MMFDSFFSLKFYLHYYCLILGLLVAMARDMRTTIDSSHMVPEGGAE